MPLKIPIHNRGYANALSQIGEILNEIEAAKDKRPRHPRPPGPETKPPTKKELEEELEEDLKKIEKEQDDDTTKESKDYARTR